MDANWVGQFCYAKKLNSKSRFLKSKNIPETNINFQQNPKTNKLYFFFITIAAQPLGSTKSRGVIRD